MSAGVDRTRPPSRFGCHHVPRGIERVSIRGRSTRASPPIDTDRYVIESGRKQMERRGPEWTECAKKLDSSIAQWRWDVLQTYLRRKDDCDYRVSTVNPLERSASFLEVLVFINVRAINLKVLWKLLNYCLVKVGANADVRLPRAK